MSSEILSNSSFPFFVQSKTKEIPFPSSKLGYTSSICQKSPKEMSAFVFLPFTLHL